MKGLLVPFFALVCGVAFGQSPTNPEEQSIWQAFGKLQFEPSVQLYQSGTVTVQGQTKSFTSNLYFGTGTDPRTGKQSVAKVELDTYDTSGKTPVLTYRAVGNGSNLFSYDVLNRQYTASFYSYYGKTPTSTYSGSDATRMLAQLYTATRGPAAYMVNLLRQVNPGNTLFPSNFETWAPGYTPLPVVDVTKNPLAPIAYTVLTPPPVVQGYSVVLGSQWVLYGPQSRNPDRSIAYQLQDVSSNSTPDIRLTGIYFTDITTNGGSNWTMTVTDPPTTIPTYAYQPFSASAIYGWRLLSGPRASTN